MSKQSTVMQLLAKNNIILDKDDIMIIKDNDPDKKYNCNIFIKCKGFTLLHKLILLSNKYPKLSDVVKEYILLYPKEVNKVNKKGWSALLLATHNNPKIVKLLLSQEHNANINAESTYGWTALMHASYNTTKSSLKNIKLLLKYNASINVKSIYGQTALMLATYNANESSLKGIELLLNYNAGVNVKNSYGQTALMVAINNCTGLLNKIIKLLLEYDSMLYPYIDELFFAKNIKILNAKN